VDFNKD